MEEGENGARESVSSAFATHALRRSERRSAALGGWNSPLLESKFYLRFLKRVV